MQRILLSTRATTVEAQLGRRVTFWEAATCLVDGLQSALAIEFDESSLSPDEEALAKELEAEKYGTSVWSDRFSRS